MKIGFISYEFPPDTGKGGIGTYVSQIAAAMAACGMDVHVFAGSNEQTSTKLMNGYKVHRVQCNNGFEFREKVVTVFDHEHAAASFDIIESPEIGGNAWEIKKKYPGLPLIIRLHAPDYLVEHLKKKYIPFASKLRFLAGAVRRLKWDLGYWRKYIKESDPDYQFVLLADRITAPSSAMQHWAEKNWQILPEKITVITNIFLPSASLLNIPVYKDYSHKQIVFFGRLNVLKGLVVASKAMKKIIDEFPEWQFKVIGDDGNGPYAGISMRNWMQKQLKPVIKKVQFLNGIPYDALPEQIADASIVLLPSLFESFSYCCAEAMAAGKAIVGSKNGGMALLLQNEISGMLVDPESVSETYSAIKKLIMDKELRYKLALNARQRILQNFNSDIAVTQFERYYKSIVS